MKSGVLFHLQQQQQQQQHPRLLRRLWCVFELAAYRIANPEGKVVFQPAGQPGISRKRIRDGLLCQVFVESIVIMIWFLGVTSATVSLLKFKEVHWEMRA